MIGIQELENILNRFYGQGTSNEEKRLIENELEKIKASADSISYCCEVLRTSMNPYAQWFASATLEYAVQSRWKLVNNKAQVREFLFQYLLEKYDMLPKYVSIKICKVQVDIAKHDWPEEYPNYFELVVTACQSDKMNHSGAGIHLLLLTIEEFALESSKALITSKRKQEIRKTLMQELGRIITVLEFVLERGLHNTQIAHGNDQESVSLAFQVLLQVMSWVPSNQWDQCLTTKIMETLFKYMSLLRSTHSVQALSCINELLDKRFLPKDVESFIVKVSLGALETLQSLVGNPQNIQLENCADGFLNQYTRFLSVFLRQHLKRVEKTASFPVDKFSTLLIEYTVSQPNADETLHCLEAWESYMSYVQELEGGEIQFQTHLQVLYQFLMRLFDQILWSKNEDMLEQLDDDPSSTGGGGSSPMNGGAGDMSASVRSGSHQSDMRDTELERYINHTIHLMSEIVVLPTPTTSQAIEPLLGAVWNGIQSTIQLISPVLSDSPQQPNDQILNAVADLTTLLQLVGTISHCFILPGKVPVLFQGVLQLLELCMNILQASNKNRLFTHGPRFLRLHVQSIKLVTSLWPWLRLVGGLANGCDEKQPNMEWAQIGPEDKQALSNNEACVGFVGNFDQAVSQILEQVLGCLVNSTWSPPPEEILTEGFELLNTIGSNLRPKRFHEYAPIQGTMANLPKVTSGLPLGPRSGLYVALSKSVLVLLQDVNFNERQAAVQHLQPLYIKIVGVEVEMLVSKVNNLAQTNSLQGSESCRPHLAILSEICRSEDGSNKFVKDFIASVVVPVLDPTISLIGLLLRPAQQLALLPQNQHDPSLRRQVAACMGTTRDALDFVVALLRSFSKQIGPERCQGAVSTLVQLFSTNAIARSLAENGSGGILLLLKLLRLLAVLMCEPQPTFKRLLDQVAPLCFNDFPNVMTALIQQNQQRNHSNQNGATPPVRDEIPETALDLFEAHYDLMHKMLRQHWQWFVSSTGETYFVRAMELLLNSFQKESMPPNIFRKTLFIFDDLQKTHRLYELEQFQKLMRPAFLSSLMKLLVMNTYQLLEEELLVTVFGLASVDFANFYTQLLPSFVRELAQTKFPINDEMVSQIVNGLPQVQDMPSFTMNFHTFSNDFRYYLATAQQQQ